MVVFWDEVLLMAEVGLDGECRRKRSSILFKCMLGRRGIWKMGDLEGWGRVCGGGEFAEGERRDL